MVGSGQPVFIIAEAGVNHNGRLDLALRLVDAAAGAGADAIKFQTFKAEGVVTKGGELVAYQKNNIRKFKNQLDMLRSLEIKESFYKSIIKRCEKKNIIFLSTPHGGFQSVDFLEKFKVSAFKFGSGDITNLPLLAYAAHFKKPIILGTGMSNMQEVRDAIRCIKKAGNDKIVVLHCTTSYPCPHDEVNLAAMRSMAKELDVLIGYSDHTHGIQAAVMATTLGASVIEKHLTLDKNFSGPDHKASVEPKEFKEMVEWLRNIPIVLGSSSKKPTEQELLHRHLVRKSLVADKDIMKGEIFTENNLAIKRPGTGMMPERYFSIIGKRAKRNISKDTILRQNDY